MPFAKGRSNMALAKDKSVVKESDSAEFDKTYPPSATTPHSGIYRCENCGDEIAANKGNPLPPQNHHQHPPYTPIQWRMIIYSQSR